MKQEKKYLNIALISSIASLFIHLYLTIHIYGLKFHLGGESAICNVSATFNCDAVATSQFAEVFGTPTSLWGFCTNLVLLLWIAFIRLNWTKHPVKLLRLSTLLSIFIFAMSVIMAAISVVALNTYCLFCIAAYITSFAQMAAIWMSNAKNPFHDLKTSIESLFLAGDEGLRVHLYFLLFVPIGSLFLNSMVNGSFAEGLDQLKARSILEWKQATTKEVEPEGALVMGASREKAKMTIVEFADFGCGHCKQAAPTLHAFALGHSDVRFVFASFPLDGACNPVIPADRISGTCILAKAVFCAEKMKQKGWAAHEFVFQKQGHISANNLTPVAELIGASSSELDTCINSPEMQELIVKQATFGKNLNIQGTPTIYVNGKPLQGGALLPILKEAYSSL